MPPHQTGRAMPMPAAMMPVFDPATMHPVFFMHNWRKTPFAMPANIGAHPVATGYVFSGNKSNAQVNTKL